MTSTDIQSELADELKAIRQDLGYIKDNMAERDSIMTEEDYAAIQDYREERKKGKLTSHKQLKKELGF